MKKRYTFEDLAYGEEVCTIRAEGEEASGGEIISALMACFRDWTESQEKSGKEEKGITQRSET